MSNEPEAMREVHEIRRQIYEETKHMTPKERADIAHCEAEKALRIYGLEHMMQKHLISSRTNACQKFSGNWFHEMLCVEASRLGAG